MSFYRGGLTVFALAFIAIGVALLVVTLRSTAAVPSASCSARSSSRPAAAGCTFFADVAKRWRCEKATKVVR